MILGIDRFMSEARALTNLVGNSLATLVVAKWVGQLDMDKLNYALANPAEIDEKWRRKATTLIKFEFVL